MKYSQYWKFENNQFLKSKEINFKNNASNCDMFIFIGE